jgi:hypothetical protein
MIKANDLRSLPYSQNKGLEPPMNGGKTICSDCAWLVKMRLSGKKGQS